MRTDTELSEIGYGAGRRQRGEIYEGTIGGIYEEKRRVSTREPKELAL